MKLTSNMVLKPCPFCGYAEPRIKKYYAGTIESGASVECPNCHIEMAYQNATCALMVANAWNKRAEPPDIPMEYLEAGGTI